MSKVHDFIKVFRQKSRQAASPAPHTAPSESPFTAKARRHRRAFIAFSCALFLVAGTWFVAGTNIPGVTAQEGESAAAFFRADRARYRARRVVRYASRLTIYREKRSRRSKSRRSHYSRKSTRIKKTRTKTARYYRPRHKKLVRKLQKTSGFQPVSDDRKVELGNRSVCVRLCDGFSFPIGQLDSRRDIKAHEAVCSGLCPASPTALYVLGSDAKDITEAVSARGRRPYAGLPVALRYTAKREKTCSCRAPRQNNLQLVSLRRDFTLRKGDAVMTKRGIRVFRGAKRWPYRKRDFKTLRRSRRILRRSARAKLYKLERASSAKSTARQANRRLQERVRIAGVSQPISAVVPLPPPRPQHLELRVVASRH